MRNRMSRVELKPNFTWLRRCRLCTNNPAATSRMSETATCATTRTLAMGNRRWNASVVEPDTPDFNTGERSMRVARSAGTKPKRRAVSPGAAAGPGLQLYLLIGVFLHLVGRKFGGRSGRRYVALEDDVDAGIGLREGDPGLQARDHLQPHVLINRVVREGAEEVRSRIDGGLHGGGNPQVREFADGLAIEFRGSDA